jgi:hypothetical protein
VVDWGGWSQQAGNSGYLYCICQSITIVDMFTLTRLCNMSRDTQLSAIAPGPQQRGAGEKITQPTQVDDSAIERPLVETLQGDRRTD